MSAYVVVDCEVTDPVRYDQYKQAAPPAIARYGGRYLARAERLRSWRATGSPSGL